MMVVGELIDEKEVGDIGATKKGFLGLLGGEMECGGPSTNATYAIRY